MAKPQESRKSGRIVKIMRDKGFGFIKDENGTEYFFHHTSTPTGAWSGLQEDQTVSFVVKDSPKGPRAEEVQLV